MNRAIWRLLSVIACLTVSASMASAQERADSAERAIRFVFQPGMLSADFVSAPPGNPATSGFYLRFATRFTTGSRWLSPIVGGSVTPYGTTGASLYNHNGPTLFAGNVFPLLAANRTGGWVSVELPLLVAYSFGGGGERNQQIYGKDVIAEAAVSVHVGQRVLRDLGGTLSRLQLYLLFDQNLTPNEDAASGAVDRFDPVALYGLTIPFGGPRNNRR